METMCTHVVLILLMVAGCSSFGLRRRLPWTSRCSGRCCRS